MTILTALWGYLVASFILMLAVKVWARVTGRRCRPVSAWYDLWVGVFWDQHKRKLYVLPLPMTGVVVDLDTRRKILAQRLEQVINGRDQCDRQPAA